ALSAAVREWKCVLSVVEKRGTTRRVESRTRSASGSIRRARGMLERGAGLLAERFGKPAGKKREKKRMRDSFPQKQFLKVGYLVHLKGKRMNIATILEP